MNKQFRAYDIVNKQVIDWGCLSKYRMDIFNNDEYELMQYTGINDVNGKPIYEGDLVYKAGEWLGVVKLGYPYERFTSCDYTDVTQCVYFYIGVITVYNNELPLTYVGDTCTNFNGVKSVGCKYNYTYYVLDYTTSEIINVCSWDGLPLLNDNMYLTFRQGGIL